MIIFSTLKDNNWQNYYCTLSVWSCVPFGRHYSLQINNVTGNTVLIKNRTEYLKSTFVTWQGAYM